MNIENSENDILRNAQERFKEGYILVDMESGVAYSSINLEENNLYFGYDEQIYFEDRNATRGHLEEALKYSSLQWFKKVEK
jgi:hypothetical protein